MLSGSHDGVGSVSLLLTSDACVVATRPLAQGPAQPWCLTCSRALAHLRARACFAYAARVIPLVLTLTRAQLVSPIVDDVYRDLHTTLTNPTGVLNLPVAPPRAHLAARLSCAGARQ